MTAKAFATCNRVLGVLTKAQLMNRGEFSVQVLIQHKDGTKSQVDVLTARFNDNSGNVELNVKE